MKTGIYSRRIKKYIIYISCVMMIMCGAVSPVHADEDETIHIHLTVENDIWDSGSGAPWQGRLMERDIAATHDETIEDILKKAFSDEHKDISFKSSRVTAAAGISDGDAGSGCRWKLSMNGTDTEISPGDVQSAGYLSDGDRIRLYYSGVADTSSDDTSDREDNGTENAAGGISTGKNSDEKDDAAGTSETVQKYENADTNDDSTVTDSDVQADGEDTAVIPEPEDDESSPEENEDVSLPETLSAEQMKAASGVSNDVKQAHDDAGKVISEAGIPSVGDVGGEWSVIGRIRSGQIRDIETDGYYLNAVNYIMMSEGSSDICETARLILGLTAAGRDVSDAGGRDLLKDVSDLDAVLEGGVRSAAMVLIALDSKQYSIPDAEQGRKQTSRDALVKYLTGAAENSGGWTADGSPDAGITAVALQALAPYHKKDASVKKTADKALEYLSKVQCSDGTFGPDKDTGSSAQVIIALTSIGIDPASDSRFIKDGMSAVDGLMSRYIPGSGFSAAAGGGADASATEQAYNALTAYELFAKGESPLYDMVDIPTVSDKKAAAEVTDMIAALGRITLDSADDIRAARTAYDALTDCGRKLVSNYDVLTAAEKKLAALKKEKDKNSGSGKDKKKTLRQKIEKSMYDFRRKRVIKFLRADSHSVDEVADYVVRELGYTEVSPSDESYQTEYSNMRASFLLQYRPELLGDLTEPQRPQQWDEKSVMEFMKQIEFRNRNRFLP